MLLFGTQMDISTFFFVCVEIVLLFQQIIFKLARPGNTIAVNNIVLLSLLITYNVASGLLPDPQFMGSEMFQNCIAYGIGFITPSFFPYYVYQSFGLTKMKWHAYKGIVYFLLAPFLLFIGLYYFSGELSVAKNVLGIPLAYSFAVIVSLIKAVRHKYQTKKNSSLSHEELLVLLVSLTPWVALPVIVFCDVSQRLEAIITNSGFLMLMALQIKQYIAQARIEHDKLLTFNSKLEKEVERRTLELKKLNENRTTAFVNLAHEVKTPLTLINNYLDDYMKSAPASEHLEGIRKNIEKMSRDIVNFFDLEKISKGFQVYNNNQTTNFSELLQERIELFLPYAQKAGIVLSPSIEENLFVQAAPESLDRIIFNLFENALKFTPSGGEILVELEKREDKVAFSVSDNGIGIEPCMRSKIFRPYFQINQHTRPAAQGMGLGLPITKQVVDSLKGHITVKDSSFTSGTCFEVLLNRAEGVSANLMQKTPFVRPASKVGPLPEIVHLENRPSILLIEDNQEMLTYLCKKLSREYNVFPANNGETALHKLKERITIPDLIISDVMMDHVDGFQFCKILSSEARFRHIPLIFLSAKTERHIKIKALQLGAINFIEKPFTYQFLEEQVKSVLKTVNLQRTALVESISGSLYGYLHQNDQFLQRNQEPVTVAVEASSSEKLDKLAAQYNLTKREREVAGMLIEGMTYQSIAECLFISEKTVTKHVQNLYAKLEVSSKIALINKLNQF